MSSWQSLSHRRRKECLQAVREWQRTKHAARVDEWRERRAQWFRSDVDELEVWVGGKDAVDDVFVLVRLAGARRIHEPPTDFQYPTSAKNHRGLLARKRRQIPGLSAPPDVGITPYRTESGTGCIDEYAIEAFAEWEVTGGRDLDDPYTAHAAQTDRTFKQPDSSRPHVGRHDDTAITYIRSDNDGLATGRRAQVEHAF